MSVGFANDTLRPGSHRRNLSSGLGRPPPMSFGKRKPDGLGESNPELIKQEVNANKKLTSEGYQ